MREKQKLRNELGQRLRSMPDRRKKQENADLVAQLTDRITESGCRTILGYRALSDEPDLDCLWATLFEYGIRIAFPRVIDRETMIFQEAHDLEQGWERSRWGIREPVYETTREIQAEQPGNSLVVIPAIAYDRTGYRLGRGGGYYDRFLARTDNGMLRIGVCFADFLLDRLPHQAHDVPVDAVFTALC